MREHLLGYLLGALDAEEQEHVKRELERNRLLRNELHAVERRLGLLASARQYYRPPTGLAARACAFVEQYRPERTRQAAALWAEPPAGRWSLSDLVVAVGILVAASALLLPGIVNSRHTARMVTCQDNLRQLGVALHGYSEQRGNGYFPCVPTSGNRAFAGYYATVLWEHGFIRDPRYFVCPESSLAGLRDQWRVPTTVQIDRARGEQLDNLQQTGGGSYGFSLGVLVNHVYRPARNDGRTYFPIMSDTPTRALTERWSSNHGPLGGGHLLYEDGRVQYFPGCPAKQFRDDPFRSRRGLVEPGVDVNDAVIGSSETTPVVPILLKN